MAPFKHVQIRREGAVEHLELNRPEVRNAFNEDLIAELASWASHAAADAGLRVVVLRGAGPTFCAGADLVWMAKMADYSQEDNIRDATTAAAMFSARGMPWPISFSIAAIDLKSSGVTIVIAVPARPARPVRPMRCT